MFSRAFGRPDGLRNNSDQPLPVIAGGTAVPDQWAGVPDARPWDMLSAGDLLVREGIVDGRLTQGVQQDDFGGPVVVAGVDDTGSPKEYV